MIELEKITTANIVKHYIRVLHLLPHYPQIDGYKKLLDSLAIEQWAKDEILFEFEKVVKKDELKRYIDMVIE